MRRKQRERERERERDGSKKDSIQIRGNRINECSSRISHRLYELDCV